MSSHKKARCPGEKPVCSLCQRLGQHCTYGQPAAPKRVGKLKAPSAHDQEAGQPERSEVSLSVYPHLFLRVVTHLLDCAR